MKYIAGTNLCFDIFSISLTSFLTDIADIREMLPAFSNVHTSNILSFISLSTGKRTLFVMELNHKTFRYMKTKIMFRPQ